jgi:hypothetical protein
MTLTRRNPHKLAAMGQGRPMLRSRDGGGEYRCPDHPDQVWDETGSTSLGVLSVIDEDRIRSALLLDDREKSAKR